ncbi:MAG: hypothetical protein U9N10_06165 [Bacillota bacterium]|nr:hypothetical protein [Bacillota bacterium]
MLDIKMITIFMGIVAIISIQYSLNLIIRLLKEVIELLHLLNMKKK